VLGQSNRGLPDPACRCVDQHGLAGCETAKRLEPGQRGGPFEDQAQRLLVGPARRYRRAGRRQHYLLGEGPVSDADHVGTSLEPGHARAEGDDHTGRLEPGDVGACGPPS
jgi:hypothetical protein